MADHDRGEIAIDAAAECDRIGGHGLCQCLARQPRYQSPRRQRHLFRPGRPTAWSRWAALNYLLLKTTSVTLAAAHLIVPTSFGQLQKTTTAGFTLTHDINYWSNVALSANFAHTDSNTSFSTGPADFFSAQLAYSYQLARDWRTRLSYTYRQRDDNTGTARANVFLLSLAYDFNLMGNPTAFDPVDAERAVLRQQRAIGEVFPTLQ